MSKAKGLGKGLGALLGAYSEPDVISIGEGPGAVQMLPLQQIEPNPLQPRTSFDSEQLQALAESISTHGIIQPLTVRRLDSGIYQIIAGERRWRAARLAGVSELPVVVIQADDKTAMELALVENLQRQDLNPMEEARGYQSLLKDYGLTQEQAAQRVGKSRSAVANSLRLLSLAPEVQTLVEQGDLSMGHAKVLLTLQDPKIQVSAAQRVITLQLSVRQTEVLCKEYGKKDETEKPKDIFKVDYLTECEKNLSRLLGRGVHIVNGKRKGRFELEFYGQDDLQRLLDALQTLHIGEEAHE